MRLLIGLGLWVIAEYVAFSLVAQAIGLDGAVLVTIATSVAGIFLLRRLGASARRSLTVALRSGEVNVLAPEKLSAGMSAGVGALLLVLPGFLSDCVGLALLAYARAWRLFETPRPVPGEIVELAPQDWRRLDEGERR
ncbi:MAG TPA: FxsA family protein [Methylovirgula sp.]